jgi:protein tyrosine phosphatase
MLRNRSRKYKKNKSPTTKKKSGSSSFKKLLSRFSYKKHKSSRPSKVIKSSLKNRTEQLATKTSKNEIKDSYTSSKNEIKDNSSSFKRILQQPLKCSDLIYSDCYKRDDCYYDINEKSCNDLSENYTMTKKLFNTTIPNKPRPIKKGNFHNYFENIKQSSEDVFDLEMKMLNTFYSQDRYKSILYKLPRELQKDRYSDILPYSHTRVKLSPLENVDHSDYINASHFVSPFSSVNNYIIGQAPTRNTTIDWWRMIWENNIKLIVMLTKEVEGNKPKADKYWWMPNTPYNFGNIQTTVINKEGFNNDETIVRTIKIINNTTKEERIVYHIQFMNWPDFGVPQIANFINLMNIYNDYRRRALREDSKMGPVLVHCSAGVGRSGVFVAVNMILDYLKIHSSIDKESNPYINVFEVVSYLREYRPGMVQTKEQYKFIYEFIDYCITNNII